MPDVFTPADVLNLRADHLAERLDSGAAPEIYRKAATVLTEYEDRHRVQFLPIPRDLLDELATAHLDWQHRDETNTEYHVSAHDMAEVVARLLAATAARS